MKETVDLVTFTEEILNGNIRFLCSGIGTTHRNSHPEVFDKELF